MIKGNISVFHSAIASYFSPSDDCGRYGMCRERIRSCPLWRGKSPRRDCVFVVEDEDKPMGCVGWTWHKFNCSFHSHSTLKSTNVLSSTGSQELVVRGTLRQGCGRSVQTSDKAGVGVQSFTLIRFSVGRISSPFSEKISYLSTLIIRIPWLHLQVTLSTILQTTTPMK